MALLMRRCASLKAPGTSPRRFVNQPMITGLKPIQATVLLIIGDR
jgi:F-type H+-transporting ATPase subunit alpha